MPRRFEPEPFSPELEADILAYLEEQSRYVLSFPTDVERLVAFQGPGWQKSHNSDFCRNTPPPGTPGGLYRLIRVIRAHRKELVWGAKFLDWASKLVRGPTWKEVREQADAICATLTEAPVPPAGAWP